MTKKYIRSSVSVVGETNTSTLARDLNYGQYGLTDKGDVVLISEKGLVYLCDGSIGEFDDNPEGYFSRIKLTLLDKGKEIRIVI